MNEITIGSRMTLQEQMPDDLRQFFVANQIPFPLLGERLTIKSVFWNSKGVFFKFGRYAHFFNSCLFVQLFETANTGIELDRTDELELINLTSEDFK